MLEPCPGPTPCLAIGATMRIGSARRLRTEPLPPAFRRKQSQRCRSRTTPCSTFSATISRTCSPGSRTSAVSTHATTDVRTPSCPQFAWPQPSSSGSVNESRSDKKACRIESGRPQFGRKVGQSALQTTTQEGGTLSDIYRGFYAPVMRDRDASQQN